MKNQKILLIAVATLLVGCASREEIRSEFRASALPYSIGKVRFVVQTGPESLSALKFAQQLIQEHLRMCRRYAPSNKPVSDVTVKVFGYNYQQVYGIFVPGRSRLVGRATWDAKGRDSYSFKVAGGDFYQNNLLQVPVGKKELFFSKPVADKRLAQTFANSFVRRMAPECAEAPRYLAWAQSELRKVGPQAGRTNSWTIGSGRYTSSSQTAAQPETNAAHIKRPEVFDGQPTPPPIPE